MLPLLPYSLVNKHQKKKKKRKIFYFNFMKMKIKKISTYLYSKNKTVSIVNTINDAGCSKS